MNPLPQNRCVLLTPPGAGGIAVIRLAGPRAKEILSGVFEPGVPGAAVPNRPRQVSYGRIIGLDSLVVDDVLVAFVSSASGPRGVFAHSFDISSHGGVRVVERIVKVLTNAGAGHATAPCPVRDAWGGTTEIERETIGELCLARTHRAVHFLATQRRKLVVALDELATHCNGHPRRTGEALRRFISSHRAARILLRGVRIALVGPPNSGKSTLFNRLAGRCAAIVSPRAGTTRDWVTASVEFHGIPVELLDTAGDHVATDGLERKAVQVGQAAAAACDLTISLVDGARRPTLTGDAAPVEARHGPPQVTAINKIDLAGNENDLSDRASGVCLVSAKTGEGVSNLVRACLARLDQAGWKDGEPSFFTDRQVAVARKALHCLYELPGQAATVIRCELIGKKTA